jgi:hypothetical protein
MEVSPMGHKSTYGTACHPTLLIFHTVQLSTMLCHRETNTIRGCYLLNCLRREPTGLPSRAADTKPYLGLWLFCYSLFLIGRSINQSARRLNIHPKPDPPLPPSCLSHLEGSGDKLRVWSAKSKLSPRCNLKTACAFTQIQL